MMVAQLLLESNRSRIDPARAGKNGRPDENARTLRSDALFAMGYTPTSFTPSTRSAFW
jgi:hypothetical protein